MDTTPESAVCDKYLKSLVNTKLIKESGFADGYGSLRNSESRNEEILFYNNGQFLYHITHVMYLGTVGSSFSEKKYRGTWGVSVQLYNDLSEKEIAIVLKYDNGNEDKHVFTYVAKGVVKLNGHNYRWSNL